MKHTWKTGDEFTMKFTVTSCPCDGDEDSFLSAVTSGCGPETETWFSAEEMALATAKTLHPATKEDEEERPLWR